MSQVAVELGFTITGNSPERLCTHYVPKNLFPRARPLVDILKQYHRDFTQKKANSYGITGWVRNTSDGKVEGEAQGDQSALDKLKKDLNDGPPAAHVVKLETRDIASKEGESEFRA